MGTPGIPARRPSSAHWRRRSGPTSVTTTDSSLARMRLSTVSFSPAPVSMRRKSTVASSAAIWSNRSLRCSSVRRARSATPEPAGTRVMPGGPRSRISSSRLSPASTSRRSYFGVWPSSTVRLARPRSPSSSATRRPRRASTRPVFRTRLDFPTPPFPLVNAMVRQRAPKGDGAEGRTASGFMRYGLPCRGSCGRPPVQTPERDLRGSRDRCRSATEAGRSRRSRRARIRRSSSRRDG